MEPTAAPPAGTPDQVVCPAAKEPAVKKIIIGAMLVIFGIWCLTDRRLPPQAWDMKHINDVANYLLNNWGPYLFLPAGGLFLAWAILALRRRLQAGPGGIGYAGSTPVSWEQVQKLDITDLGTKGIAVLHHGGKRMKLDSYYLQNFAGLMAVVDKHVPPEKRVTR